MCTPKDIKTTLLQKRDKKKKNTSIKIKIYKIQIEFLSKLQKKREKKKLSVRVKNVICKSNHEK